MQHSRFLVLTGHLNDYPLSELVGILRHQQKTGRLLIEYPESPASFYFNDGELVDAQLDHLSGLQAVCVAIAQPPSSFNFNPLIRPTRRTIENSLQKVVSELLGCWGGNDIEVVKIAPSSQVLAPAPQQSAASGSALLGNTSRLLALSPAPGNRFSRPILAMAAAGLLLLGLSTVIAVTSRFGIRGFSVAVPPPTRSANTSGPMPLIIEGQSPITRSEITLNPKVHHAVGKNKDGALHSDPVTRPASRTSSVDAAETEGTDTDQRSAAPATGQPEAKAHVGQTGEVAAAETHSVKVLLQIEGGRVAQASIANHRSGMEAYEGLALRIARQRRYPSKGPILEMVTIKVSPPK